jgi:hypothetical protein
MFPQIVVPAKAGTYTLRPIVEGRWWTTFAQRKVLWLWVPAPRAQLRTRAGWD